MGVNAYGAGNHEIVPLPSLLRTATTNSPDFENIVGAKGLIVTLDWTVEADTASLTLHIQHKAPASGVYEDLFVASSALTAVGVATYILYPNIGTATGDVTQISGMALGRVWRIRVVHADADAATYSVSATYIL